MIYETKINLRNKTKEELILFINEGLQTIQKYEEELKKKNKTITKMAKKLNQAYFEEDKFCQWFEKEVMQVQEKPDYGYVADLIKEYFERKVEK